MFFDRANWEVVESWSVCSPFKLACHQFQHRCSLFDGSVESAKLRMRFAPGRNQCNVSRVRRKFHDCRALESTLGQLRELDPIVQSGDSQEMNPRLIPPIFFITCPILRSSFFVKLLDFFFRGIIHC